MAPGNQYCSYGGGGAAKCASSREPTLPPAYKMAEPLRLPRRTGPDGFPVYRTEPTPPYQPNYVRFTDTASGPNATDQLGSRQVSNPSAFPTRNMPVDVSQYYSSGPTAYRNGFGSSLIPSPVCPPPVTTQHDTNRVSDGGTKPWSAHPPDPNIMKVSLRKYRNDHKISGFAGFFPGTHNMLGGSIYRIVTLEQEAENRPYGSAPPYGNR